MSTSLPNPAAPGAAAPWYAPGLRFRCLGPECGDCCSGKHGPGAVWVNPQEMQALASHLGIPFDAFTRRYVRAIRDRYSLTERANHDCVFYDRERGCTVYAARPSQCRTYPFWSRVMALRASWESEAKACPGIGDPGGTVPAEEIRRALDEDGRRFPEGRPDP